MYCYSVAVYTALYVLRRYSSTYRRRPATRARPGATAQSAQHRIERSEVRSKLYNYIMNHVQPTGAAMRTDSFHDVKSVQQTKPIVTGGGPMLAPQPRLPPRMEPHSSHSALHKAPWQLHRLSSTGLLASA